MKRNKTFLLLFTSLFIASVLHSQATKSKGVAGNKITFAGDDVSFSMVYVPGNLTFPTDEDDKGHPDSVDKAYWIGETEVTYELWYKVRTWAENNGYKFANKGREGSNGEDGAAPTVAKNNPVTNIDWRDAVIFANAITDWYNYLHKTKYSLVYYADYNSKKDKYIDPIKSISADVFWINIQVNSHATGFRQLTSSEWNAAAKYKDSNNCGANPCVTLKGSFWTPGNYASGATDTYKNNSATKAVAWCEAKQTQDVKKLKPNDLGLYDMSGNVWEWCFDEHKNKQAIRGGGYSESQLVQVGFMTLYPGIREARLDRGLRLARTAD